MTRRNSRGMSGHHSAKPKTEDWATPRWVLEPLGRFDLDPAAMAKPPWRCADRNITKHGDGLSQRWRGRVWLNPPYSITALSAFLKRMAEHHWGTALIFARTETRPFSRFVWEAATALLFIEGRLHFCYPDGREAAFNAGAPSVLVAYGMKDADILAGCGIAGRFVPNIIPRSVLIEVLPKTWRQAIEQWFDASGSDVADVEDIYRALRGHPVARRNRNIRPKIRQTLNRGGFRRVDRGKYALSKS